MRRNVLQCVHIAMYVYICYNFPDGKTLIQSESDRSRNPRGFYVRCSELQCVTSVLQSVAVLAVRCSALKCVAVCCSVYT